MNDMINHPDHYAGHYSREVIDLTAEMNFCNGNACKYILRSPWKGREIEDLEKAIWYVKHQRDSGIDEYWDEEVLALFSVFMADLAAQGRDNLYRALAAIREHDYAAAIHALKDAISEAEAKLTPPEMDEAFL